jgi:two-component system sensor histidine kinase KdpD
MVAQEAALVAGLLGVAAALASVASTWLDTGSLVLIFLIAVTVAGAFLGLRAALLTSVGGFLACNFLFTEPRFTLLVVHSDDVTSLVAFLIVSVIVGHLAGRLHERAEEARRSAERVTTLFDFTRRIYTAVDELDLTAAATAGIGAVLGRRCLLLPVAADGTLRVGPDIEREDLFDATDLERAQQSLTQGESGAETGSDTGAAGWWFEPMSGLGVLAIDSGPPRRELDAEERRLLFALRTQFGAAWERFRLQRTAADARIEEASTRLRSMLLASVSHDLRTPLVSVIGSLTALRDLDARLSSIDRRELLQTALVEAQRLNRLVQNLLDMTRLGHGALQPRLRDVDVAETVTEALRRLEGLYVHRRVELQLEAGLGPVRADRTLLEQVLVNLLENAAKYSRYDEPVTIAARCVDDAVVVSVTDRGQGIPAELRDRLFEPFQRGGRGDSGDAGHGLGLAICRGFVEAMHGAILARPGPAGSGTTIEVTLPAAEAKRLAAEERV